MGDEKFTVLIKRRTKGKETNSNKRSCKVFMAVKKLETNPKQVQKEVVCLSKSLAKRLVMRSKLMERTGGQCWVMKIVGHASLGEPKKA